MKRRDWILNNRKELIEKRTIPELKILDILRDKTHFKIEVQKHVQCGDKIYFADIFLPKIKVAIEVDGSSHRDKFEQDRFRDISMARKGIMTFRINNQDVYNPIKVNELINDVIEYARARRLKKIRKHTDVLRIVCNIYGNKPIYIKCDK